MDLNEQLPSFFSKPVGDVNIIEFTVCQNKASKTTVNFDNL